LFFAADYQETEQEPDQEELESLGKLRNLKHVYREAYEQLQFLRREIEYITRSVERGREKLLTEFEMWYTDMYMKAASESKEESPDSEDVLDYQEKFDKLEQERIMQEDPESIHFYNARKVALSARRKSGGKSRSSSLPAIARKGSPFR
jgi:dsDNA-specific endonuclease/ATPase MutS2